MIESSAFLKITVLPYYASSDLPNGDHRGLIARCSVMSIVLVEAMVALHHARAVK